MDVEAIQEQEEEIATLKSIFENEIIEAPSTGLDNSNGKKSLQIKIPINLDSPIKFKVFFHFKPEVGTNEVATTPTEGASATNFITSEHQFSSLPVILLDLTLPLDYPSVSPPAYVIRCEWIDDSHYKQIFSELDSLWTPGVGVLFSWVDWVSNSLLSALTSENNGLELDSLRYSYPTSDPRIARELRSIDQLVPLLLQQDEEMEETRFLESELTCEVCFDSKKGREFYRLLGCPHLFCMECLSGYCQMHVKEGTVQNLKCPTKSCDVLIHPSIVADAVGKEEFERWERLLLERTLDMMEDMQYCPRCQYPAECDLKQKQAICAACYFVFCSDCQLPWHLGPCLDGDQVALVELSKLKKAKITKAEFILRSQKISELKKSESFLKKTSQSCPNCKVPIHKFDGCNKVSCNQCSTSFCYVCGRQGGYEHFNSGKCNLFGTTAPDRVPFYQYENAVPERFNVMQDAMLREGGKAQQINCLSCRQMNAKIGNNNHIRCWACNAQICYFCKSRIVGSVGKHYSALKCPQHS